jgi:hypothetical protein
LRNISSGNFGAGGKQLMFNQARWSGDFNTAGVTRIQAQMNNFGQNELSMRLAIRGGPNFSTFASTNAVTLSAGSGWRPVTFDLTTNGMSLVSGSDMLVAVLGSVFEMRVLSAALGPTFIGDTVAATLGVDDVRALRLPGDANFDGLVGFPDLVAVAQHYDQQGADWSKGDFNFDGVVNFQDLVTVAQNYDTQGPATAAVPEPGGFVSIMVSLIVTATARHRRPKAG